MSSADKSDGQFDFSSFPPSDGRVSASCKHIKTTLVPPSGGQEGPVETEVSEGI